MQSLESYGLHWEGPVGWLVQGRNKFSNFVGLKGRPEFRAPQFACNHLVPNAAPQPDTTHWQHWEKLHNDPLVEAMLPTPRSPGQNLFYLSDPYDDFSLYLTNLSRLSSPIHAVVKPAWMLRGRDLDRLLVQSNIQPLVITKVTTKNQELVDKIGEMGTYAPRTVVLTGDPNVVVSRPMQRIETEIRDIPIETCIGLPMENIGALLIRRCARREDLKKPVESRSDRKARRTADYTSGRVPRE